MLTAVYSNHFDNSFHFDDSHAITENPYIRDLGNWKVFFKNAETFSSHPEHQEYRPLTTLSIAFDYWLAGGYKNLFYFHILTFLFYIILLIAIQKLTYRLLTWSDSINEQNSMRDRVNWWFAFMASVIFGLHPVSAETVNYIIQRADLYSALFSVVALLIYTNWHNGKKLCLYFIPITLGVLAKESTLAFGPIFAAYILLFEQNSSLNIIRERRKLLGAVIKTLPVFFLMIALFYLNRSMHSGAPINFSKMPIYWATQTYVVFRYFRAFFLPYDLTADTDWHLASSFYDSAVILGALFIFGLSLTIYKLSFSKKLRVISFGLLWFLLALLPTSIIPLDEVTNDHRMFFSFVGLVIALSASLKFIYYQYLSAERLTFSKKIATLFILTGIVIISSIATYRRNEVWHNEETLWFDTTIKSPKNGRGLMNYGLTRMSKGDYNKALEYFTRALEFIPYYGTLHVNIAIVNGALGRDQIAETHFRQAILYDSRSPNPFFFYARWLLGKNRIEEAHLLIKDHPSLFPYYLNSRYLLMSILQKKMDFPKLRAEAESILKDFPKDQTAKKSLIFAEALLAEKKNGERTEISELKKAEDLLDLSLLAYNIGNFELCVEAAAISTKIDPNYAEGYNNIAACNASLGRWDASIAAAEKALLIKPDYQLAKNNLEWAKKMKSGL
ncbi:MAG TPA: hypothetical protein PKA79_01950 [Oligoflexia bacterium]|nr:hypothetical protein [Oligoflexia bacterium]